MYNKEQCQVILNTYNPQQASIEYMHQYTECVNLMHPKEKPNYEYVCYVFLAFLFISLFIAVKNASGLRRLIELLLINFLGFIITLTLVALGL